jgi:hypothetical protein
MKRTLLLLTFVVSALGQTPSLYDPDTIRDLHLTFPQTNYWTLLTNNYASQTEIPADLVVEGVTYPSVAVRFRGNTSYTQLPSGSQKKSFNIRMDVYTPGQKLLGYEHLNLNNGFHDPTFVREFLVYRIMGMYGLSPKANFVRLWINGAYWGIYINVQQPNKDMMGEWFKSRDGNRYRCFPTSGSFSNGRCAFMWLGNQVSQYFSAYQVNSGDALDLMNMCDVLNNTPSNLLPPALNAVFSVDQFYRYAAVMNILTNTDSYIGTGKDHYLFQDQTHGILHCFPFDVNEGLYGSTSLSPSSNFTSSIKPAMSKTWVHPFWQQRYYAHYRTIYEDVFQSGLLASWASQYHAMIFNDVVADTKKIYSTTQFTNNLTQTVTVSSGGFGGSTSVPGLLPFISARTSFLSTQSFITAPRASLSNLVHTPLVPSHTQSVTVTATATPNATALTLFYRILGGYQETPMFDDGLHGDGAALDGTFGAEIPAQGAGTYVSYYVEAQTSTGARTYLPKTGELHAPEYRVDWLVSPSELRINEFVAQNTSGAMDEMGQFEDWVEIYNPTNQAIALDGYHLTDDLQNSTKWSFPAGTTIAAGGTLLVWCDEDPLDGPLHTSFKLAAGGEEIGLFESDGISLIDSFEFGSQLANVSTARHGNGTLPWVTFTAPSPNASNALLACGSRVYLGLNPLDHAMGIALIGAPSIGSSVLFNLSGGTPSGTAYLFASALPGTVEIPGFAPRLLLSLQGLQWMTLPLDGNGGFNVNFALPNDPALINQRLILQGFEYVPQGSTLLASGALEVIFCP